MAAPTLIEAFPLAAAVDPTIDVLLLPREIVNEQGLYDDSVVMLAKYLRAEGVSARYQHDPDERAWIGEKHVPQFVIDIIAGVGSNAGWDAFGALFKRQKSKEVRLRVARINETAEGREIECYELEGPGAEVAEALKVLRYKDADTRADDDGKAI
jgi:hypothetical protein